MIKIDIIKYVLRNLKRRKLRTSLTALSIFIGVTTIFIFVSFGLGLYNYINELSQGSSIDKVIIQQKGIVVPGSNKNFQLTDKDLELIKRVPGVYEVTPIIISPIEIQKNDEKYYPSLIAYDPLNNFIFDISNVKVEKGRELRREDKNKILLGNSYKKENKIFSKPFDVNQKILVNKEEFIIIGFLEEIGSPQDDAQVYITIDKAKELFPNKTGYDWLIAKVDLKEIDSIIDKITETLRKEKNQKKGEEDFFVQSFNDLIRSYSSALNIIIGFVILIALFSVIVSAINTSNTMISSILERYREIGVMKSIGAKNSEILLIFLIESALVGFFAGLIGIFFGFVISFIGGKILSSLGWGFLKPLFSIWLFLFCILFSTFTGAIAGVLPAYKASKINPVEALRYE